MKRIICLMLVSILLVSSYGCSKAGMGAGTGMATGAAVGALVSRNKLVGAAIGAGAGLLLGYAIGNELDKSDLAKAASTLEHGQPGIPVNWKNYETGNSYQATPSQVYKAPSNVPGAPPVIWRDMTIKSNSGEDIYVRAVRRDNGTWELWQQNS